MDRLSVKLMNNPKVAPPSPPKGTPSSRRGSPPSHVGSDGEPHVLARLKDMEGYTSKRLQQRCVMCNKDTAWYCTTCSDGPNSLVPVHPEFTLGRRHHNGERISHPCLGQHRCNPSFFPKGKRGGKRRAKRVRADCSGLDSDDDGEDPNAEEFDEDGEQCMQCEE